MLFTNCLKHSLIRISGEPFFNNVCTSVHNLVQLEHTEADLELLQHSRWSAL